MKLKIREIVLFGMLGGLMFALKLAMESLPNIHLVGVLIVAITVVYRMKALYPLYLFVFIFGLYYGFSVWWLPYLYIWTVLWGAVMLLPKNMPPKVAPIVYIAVCGLHGFLFGALYAPSQALLMGLNFEQTLAWIAAGIFPYDIIHGISNTICGVLIMPIINVLRLADRI
ncbi:MAG: hypothetical protein IJ292_00405 [Clostridia bacterium]|nr:hypothetical protein [Clostridia bacterium]